MEIQIEVQYYKYGINYVIEVLNTYKLQLNIISS